MKRKYGMIKGVLASLAAALLAGGCNSADEPAGAETIKVNTRAINDFGPTDLQDDGRDKSFMLLLWLAPFNLENAVDDPSFWKSPYLAGHAPQSVSFYDRITFDTDRTYPSLPVYATGYSPGALLKPDDTAGYRKLAVQSTPTVNPDDLGRYDFMSCDVWSEVYSGSEDDPFSQEKNRLYFRHLASKLLFYAYREKSSMENKQFVRNVKVKNLRMSIDGGVTWTAMHTPRKMEWMTLGDGDFTASYNDVITKVRGLAGNETAAGTRPKAGYKVTESMTFAGENSGYVLQRHNIDRVPIEGQNVDSCFVCSPMAGGVVQKKLPIKLKMDISAEMSYDRHFSEPEGGSATDNLTFTKEWLGVVLDKISVVDASGNATSESVDEFKPGREYRVYIKFSRTGIDLVAKQLPWDFGCVFVITIVGGDSTEQNP